MPHSAYQVWQDFAKTIVNERDPERVSDLVAKLNRELAEIDQGGDASAMTEIHTVF